MGKEVDRRYIRNFAKTLMSQLRVDVPRGQVGISSYCYDVVASGIREDLVELVYLDLRHLKGETVARLATCGIMGTAEGQHKDYEYLRLQSGLDPCTMCFVHHWNSDWIGKKKNDGPAAVIKYMAATAVVAAMYDLVVQKVVE